MTEATIALPPLTVPQMAIWGIPELGADARCVAVEGSPRAAKSWGVGLLIWRLVLDNPGIQIFYSRYLDQGLTQLRDVLAKVNAYFPPALHPTWNASDQAYDWPPTADDSAHPGLSSRVYLSALKSSEIDSVHAKYKGKTLAVVIIEEAAEVPRVHYLGLKERLSQSRTPKGDPYPYPLHIICVHNCVDEDHWLAKEFPLDAQGRCTREGHLHIRADLHSNARNLGPVVMAGYEADYPPGHTLRRTVIEGRRGVTLTGTPVYSTSFRPGTHIDDRVVFTRGYPLLEGWDFGEEKPAVVWLQYLRHLAAIRILGAVKGDSLFLELFAPKVLEIRRRLFPHATEIRSWCDPTGATGNGGLQYTPIALLHQLGVPARATKDPESARDGNDAEVRYAAIQTIAGYMLRVATDGSPAFLMAPTCIGLERAVDGTVTESPSHLLATAFEAGYIWDTKAASEARPNIRKPKKGTRYDDLMNALEYPVIGEGIPLAPSVALLATAAATYQTAGARETLRAEIARRVALRNEQRDTHPIDGVRGARVQMPARVGRRSFY